MHETLKMRTNQDTRQGQSLVFLSLHLDTQGQDGT